MVRTVDPAKHRARRQHILHASAPLFAARGLDATTTAAICRAAGMSSGNLFHYFASKRDIFVALLTDGTDETAEVLDAAETAEDPWAALVAIVDHLARPAAEPLVPKLVLEAMLQAERDEELARLLDRDARREKAAVRTLVQRAADGGRVTLPCDAEQIATWIMGMIGGLYLAAATEEHYDTAQQVELLHLSIERLLQATP